MHDHKQGNLVLNRYIGSCWKQLVVSLKENSKGQVVKTTKETYFRFSRSVKSKNAVASRSLPSRPPSIWDWMRSRF